MASSQTLLNLLEQVQRRALMVAGIGVLLALLGIFLNRPQFFQSYLFAYFFWLGIGLGCLTLLLVYHLTSGRWGFMLRRVLESAAVMTVLMALLTIPLFFGMTDLYSWANAANVATDPLLQHKQPYLNIPFFIIRNGLYFVIWCGVAGLLWRWSGRQDQPADTYLLSERQRRFSGPALALYGLTITFAAMDWLMSLEPHWFSTIFGAMIAAAQVVTALALATIVLIVLAKHHAPLHELVDQRLDDLGKLLLALALFWVYMAFIQYLIIWAGNLPEEVVWYLRRLRHGWQWVALLVLLFHFVLPFVALLAGRVRKGRRNLVIVAAGILGADLLYFYWLVTPVFHPTIHLHWLDLVLPCAIGGLWLAALAWQLRRRPLLVQYDPVWTKIETNETALQEVMAHE
ncbi:MAG: hypothetical protein R2867_11415 [Caldilineaceae bacterium]